MRADGRVNRTFGLCREHAETDEHFCRSRIQMEEYIAANPSFSTVPIVQAQGVEAVASYTGKGKGKARVATTAESNGHAHGNVGGGRAKRTAATTTLSPARMALRAHRLAQAGLFFCDSFVSFNSLDSSNSLDSLTSLDSFNSRTDWWRDCSIW
jgi:hypothetical protein